MGEYETHKRRVPARPEWFCDTCKVQNHEECAGNYECDCCMAGHFD